MAARWLQICDVPTNIKLMTVCCMYCLHSKLCIQCSYNSTRHAEHLDFHLSPISAYHWINFGCFIASTIDFDKNFIMLCMKWKGQKCFASTVIFMAQWRTKGYNRPRCFHLVWRYEHCILWWQSVVNLCTISLVSPPCLFWSSGFRPPQSSLEQSFPIAASFFKSFFSRTKGLDENLTFSSKLMVVW